MLDAAESTEAAIAVDRSLLDLRIGGAWRREDLPVEYAIGFDAATARSHPAPARPRDRQRLALGRARLGRSRLHW